MLFKCIAIAGGVGALYGPLHGGTMRLLLTQIALSPNVGGCSLLDSFANIGIVEFGEKVSIYFADKGSTGNPFFRNESEPGAADKVDEEANICADIVACVPKDYSFEGMADYQYVVPVHADVTKRKKRYLLEPKETHLAKGGCINVVGDDFMLIVPPIFAPKDMPEDLVHAHLTVLF
ncbi:hypothetical protein TSUD_300450 [Trifolium subterraneum]|uniref:Uncharacterized protein n=1 Tax=Trifolium subterraneum TaxID=3900 RepID=A0A2Z6NZC0_TRISU|nr:hypothetical protein TSUD_300450 [Trifolium subterraneum]